MRDKEKHRESESCGGCLWTIFFVFGVPFVLTPLFLVFGVSVLLEEFVHWIDPESSEQLRFMEPVYLFRRVMVGWLLALAVAAMVKWVIDASTAWRRLNRAGARGGSFFINSMGWLALPAVVFGLPALAVLLFAAPADEPGSYHFIGLDFYADTQPWLYATTAAAVFAVAVIGSGARQAADTLVYKLGRGRRMAKRAPFFRAFAEGHGLRFQEKTPGCMENLIWPMHEDGSSGPPRVRMPDQDPPVRYDPIVDLWVSLTGYAQNVVTGKSAPEYGPEATVYLFDYHECTGGQVAMAGTPFAFPMETAPIDYSVVVIEQHEKLPPLIAHPDSVWDDVVKRGGALNVDMEWLDFADNYRVWCRDKRFAYAVCNSQMMEFLAAHPGVSFRTDGRLVSLCFHDPIPKDGQPDALRTAFEAWRLIPPFVYDPAWQAQSSGGAK